ncbi:hypothetical protein [Persicobacter diffluens]|uniref:Outer membrane protein beta-barrel domain-containing protein n=1 Tax=Persicobacter diffluens TaxID=981 RepID=A0AAN4VY41_9BACT|nr:hypothetical protein PEDI_21640 [Persicobacter diffluens]
MKKIIVFVLSLMISAFAQAETQATSQSTKAQGNLELGMRLSVAPGISGVYQLGGPQSVEGLLQFKGGATIVTGLYRYNFGLISPEVPGLSWYAGAGAHTKIINGATVGIDGIIGLQYDFDEIPLNISMDWKPAFDIFGPGGGDFHADDIAISVRFKF